MARMFDRDCRWCRQPSGEHLQSCVWAPDEPDADDRLADAEDYDRAEDRLIAAATGERIEVR